ncbi:MAG: hypothetical protein WCI55_08620 [Armatimonadota bacterium]
MFATVVMASLLASQSPFTPDPAKVELHFEDIERFYKTLDSAEESDLGEKLKAGYLNVGSKGLAYFRLTKFRMDDLFIAYVKKNRAQLQKDREKIFQIKDAENRIRASFFAFKFLYSDAVYPPLYFVIGRESAG